MIERLWEKENKKYELKEEMHKHKIMKKIRNRDESSDVCE